MNDRFPFGRVLIYAESLLQPLARTLENWLGGGTYIIDNQQDVISSLETGAYDILCCSVHLEECLELCWTIKAKDTIRHYPVVIVTDSEADTSISYLQAGAEAFLFKPDRKLFLSQLCSILGNRCFVKAALTGQNAVSPVSGSSRNAAFISRLKNFISANIQETDLSVSRLASAMNMSPSNLFRRVRETLDMSPNALVNEMRLSKAKEILDGNEKSISEIVFLTGFNSHSYFSKCFKRRYGISPSEYSEENRDGLTVK